MQVNTVVYNSVDWKIKVHTSRSQYKNQGAYFTCCSMRFSNGASVILVSRYSNTQALAISNHLTIAAKAKELFALKVSK